MPDTRDIKNIRARLERWELTHLRELAASLHTRLEAAEARADEAERWAYTLEREGESMPEELMQLCEQTGASIGLTQQGEIVVLKPDAEPATQQQPALAAPGEYWSGQGGHYICTLPTLADMPARHLIAGADEADDLIYGPDVDIAGATSHSDGAANTAALLASGKDHPAATWAHTYTADGHTDFFLPSRLDMFMAYICAPQLFQKSGWYQTSTQTSRVSAFVQGFEYGGSYWDFKGDGRRVRAFRVVQLEPLNA